jgi:4-hydroxythreonine-4-phosphate dehydrogenase
LKKVKIAISLGDPAGIGPEVTRKALRDPGLRRDAEFILIGRATGAFPRARPSRASGLIAARAVREAAALALKAEVDALVTAPISKEALHLAGEPYAGHTELLAELAGLKPDQVGMLLVGGGLSVFLVTRHVSLKKAISLLNAQALQKAVRLCAAGLRQDFSIKHPRLALAALNPHAGEAGAFGDEEARVLRPVLRSFAKQRDFSLQGPFPADSVFVKALRGAYDAVICLYHDQGLIPLKLLAFDTGVNVTLGLPFIRSSPDHGTAYDIAGKNKANPSSMIAAIRLAITLSNTKKKLGNA